METSSLKVYGIVQHNGCILLVKDLVGKPGWKCVGGHKEDGETLEEALIRERQEEVGLTIRVGEILATKDFFRPTDPNAYHVRVFYMCESTSEEVTVQKDEIAEAKWFRVEELQMMPDNDFYADHLEAIRLFLRQRQFVK